jgi:hypothetical protein
MDDYSPLRGIIDALTKLRYEIPYFGSGNSPLWSMLDTKLTKFPVPRYEIPKQS